MRLLGICAGHAIILGLLLVFGSGNVSVSASEDGGEAQETGDVLVVTDANVDGVIAASSHLLLEFYAPWCGRCQEVAPAFQEAASTLKW